jgi:hypothetical protein
MSVASALRTAVKNSPDAFKASLQRAKTLLTKIKRKPGVGRANQLEQATKIRADATAAAKSNDDAVDTVKAIDDGTPVSHPLDKNPDGTPKTSTTGDAPPPKEPTTQMPDGGPKTQSRWDQVSPYVVGGGTAILAGVGVATWLTVAGVFNQNTDGVEVKITKIEKVKDQQKQYKFTYQTQGGQKCGSPPIACIQSAFKPCKDDVFTFRNTYTEPSLNDVTALVIDVDDDAVYFELDLSSIGNGTPEWGFMTCHNSFRNQFRSSVREGVQLLVDVAEDVADPLVGGFCDVVPLPFICPGAFNAGNWVLWLIIICCLLLCVSIILLLIL